MAVDWYGVWEPQVTRSLIDLQQWLAGEGSRSAEVAEKKSANWERVDGLVHLQQEMRERVAVPVELIRSLPPSPDGNQGWTLLQEVADALAPVMEINFFNPHSLWIAEQCGIAVEQKMTYFYNWHKSVCYYRTPYLRRKLLLSRLHRLTVKAAAPVLKRREIGYPLPLWVKALAVAGLVMMTLLNITPEALNTPPEPTPLPPGSDVLNPRFGT